MLVSAAWLGPAILAAFQVTAQAKLWNSPPVTWRAVLWEGGDWLIYAALTPVVFAVSRRLPLRAGHLLRRVPVHLVASLGLCAAWAGTGAVLRWLVMPDAAHAVSPRGLASWFLTSLPFGVAVYFAVLGIEHAARYFVEARERETLAARLSAQLAEARLGALRMQIHPHFLLNSLNAILVLVRDGDTGTAVGVLERLGEVLHRVLRTDGSHEIPLADEVAFLEQYLVVEQVRFSDRLRPVFDLDPAVLRAAVPEFVLQPLVENALRHGVARRTEAGRLTISARREGNDLVLAVRDDGPGLAADARDGVGLTNTRARLATLYGDRARLELADAAEGGAVATIRLPYHESGLPARADG